MVIGRSQNPVARRASLMIELVFAMAITVGLLLPLVYSLASEKRLTRSYYQRAVAMELVDGEMEALAAGQWRAFGPGVHDYTVHANAVTNLPPGKFVLTIRSNSIRLEWRTHIKGHGGSVMREVKFK
jgi:hypothetical protein